MPIVTLQKPPLSTYPYKKGEEIFDRGERMMDEMIKRKLSELPL